MLPVGGLVASTGESRLLDEGFQQNRTIRVAGMLVVSRAWAEQNEDARSQVMTHEPWQDEEACVVDDQVQVALALLARTSGSSHCDLFATLPNTLPRTVRWAGGYQTSAAAFSPFLEPFNTGAEGSKIVCNSGDTNENSRKRVFSVPL